MVDAMQASAVRHAVADVFDELGDVAYLVSDEHRVALDILADVFEDTATDKRLIQAAQAFLLDMPYFEGNNAQLDAALDALRNALA